MKTSREISQAPKSPQDAAEPSTALIRKTDKRVFPAELHKTMWLQMDLKDLPFSFYTDKKEEIKVFLETTTMIAL